MIVCAHHTASCRCAASAHLDGLETVPFGAHRCFSRISSRCECQRIAMPAIEVVQPSTIAMNIGQLRIAEVNPGIANSTTLMIEVR